LLNIELYGNSSTNPNTGTINPLSPRQSLGLLCSNPFFFMWKANHFQAGLDYT